MRLIAADDIPVNNDKVHLLHSPIQLDIEQHEEIALSVLAEITMVLSRWLRTEAIAISGYEAICVKEASADFTEGERR